MAPLDCEDFEESLQIFRRPYEQAGVRYRSGAVICISCGTISDLSEFDIATRREMQSWSRSVFSGLYIAEEDQGHGPRESDALQRSSVVLSDAVLAPVERSLSQGLDRLAP